MLPDEVIIENYKMIKNLKPNTNYTFYVRSYVTAASESSEQVTCKTGTINMCDKIINLILDQ